jgi:hypothetical protein
VPAGVAKVVSGGQTGVDRAALDAARAAGIAIGGWCPKGRRAEDGPIAEHYPLTETDSPNYKVRTRKNVEDADATLVLLRGGATGGTKLTIDIAKDLGRPCLVVDLDGEAEPSQVEKWLAANAVRVLNVAGPRESTAPGIGAAARRFLERLFTAA